MSDRSYGTLTLYGAIKKVGDVKHLIEMIAGAAPHMIDDEASLDDIGALQAILDAANGSLPLRLADEELSGGEMDTIMSAAKNAGMPFVATWDGNYAYPAGCRCWDPKNGNLEAAGWNDEQPLLSFQELETALGCVQRAKALRQLVDEGKRLRGEAYPPITLSKNVRAYVEKQLGD